MLRTAIILPGEPDLLLFNSLGDIEGVEWDGIYYPGKCEHHTFKRAFIFSSPEIFPLICDLLIVLDSHFCTYDYLSFAIRNGCHLFLSDKLELTTEGRRQLIHLANEGGTYIRIQNDFLIHSFQKKIGNQPDRICFIEVLQSAPGKYNRLNELLLNNLLMILRAAGSPVHKIDIFGGTIHSPEPDVLHIHINFKNGSVATLTLKFIDHQEKHCLSVHAGGEVTIFDFVQNRISHLPDKQLNRIVIQVPSDPFKEQIADFIRNIEDKNNPEFSLDDEILVFQLMEKIREKISYNSFSTQ